MRKILAVLALSSALLGTSSSAMAQVSVRVRIGPPPAPRYYVAPKRPGPNYAWVEGYWYPQGKHYRWRNGYWARPPYRDARWVSPYYAGGRYYRGYWARDVRSDHRSNRNDRRDRNFHGDSRHR